MSTRHGKLLVVTGVAILVTAGAITQIKRRSEAINLASLRLTTDSPSKKPDESKGNRPTSFKTSDPDCAPCDPSCADPPKPVFKAKPTTRSGDADSVSLDPMLGQHKALSSGKILPPIHSPNNSPGISPSNSQSLKSSNIARARPKSPTNQSIDRDDESLAEFGKAPPGHSPASTVKIVANPYLQLAPSSLGEQRSDPQASLEKPNSPSSIPSAPATSSQRSTQQVATSVKQRLANYEARSNLGAEPGRPSTPNADFPSSSQLSFSPSNSGRAQYHKTIGLRQGPATYDQRPPINLAPQIEDQVRRQIEYGKTLARRGATHSAREEFVAALRLVAEALDQKQGDRRHSRALADGFTALHEAQDFVNKQGQGHSVLNVARIASRHTTPALKSTDVASLTPQQAMQAYYQYAEREFIEACRAKPVAGLAFHALGKSYTIAEQTEKQPNAAYLTQSMLMFRLATETNPHDFQSLNELGVLLARSGNWADARNLFLESLRIQRTAAAWNNLASAHQALGEYRLAKLAIKEFRSMREDLANGETQRPGSPIRWVSKNQLVNLAPPSPTKEHNPAPRAMVPPGVPRQTKQQRQRSFLDKLF